jgi:hypothetical protein
MDAEMTNVPEATESVPSSVVVIDESMTKAKPIGGSLKLRLKVKEEMKPQDETIDESESVQQLQLQQDQQNVKKGPKMIKLNFSRSSDSVIAAVPVPRQRGRPKKDKNAVLAAAMAAAQPNELESEERRGRRRAAEEKIKQSVVVEEKNSVVPEAEVKAEEPVERKRRGRRPKVRDEDGKDDEDGMRKRRRRRRLGDSSDSLDLGQNPTNELSASAIPTPRSVFNPHENDFLQRSKAALNISLQHETFMYNSVLNYTVNPAAFTSVSDAVERLVPFHLGITSGQYTSDELSTDQDMSDGSHEHAFCSLQDRYRSILDAQASKKVATELLLLEQRLCLEEEKFLLVKLKNEYTAKFLKSSASTSNTSSASTSRSNSVINS